MSNDVGRRFKAIATNTLEEITNSRDIPDEQKLGIFQELRTRLDREVYVVQAIIERKGRDRASTVSNRGR